MSKTSFFLTVLVIIIFSGCQSEQQRWNGTQRTNTLLAYRSFVHDYPEGEYSSKAQERIEALTYERACKKNDLYSYKDYLKSYPYGRYVSQCKEKITAIQMKEQATQREKETAQREKEAKRLQLNRERLNILKQYEVNKTTEKQFQKDGWTASDITCEKLGILYYDKRKESSRYTIGFIDPDFDVGYDLCASTIGEFLQHIYEEQMMDEENVTFGPTQLQVTSRSRKQHTDIPTIQVCVLEFEEGVLKDIQFTKVSEIEEQ